MDEDEDLMGLCEGFCDALVAVAVAVDQAERTLARLSPAAQWDKGADLVIGCVGILPRIGPEEFREGLRLNRSP
jgi:hypothetical protein